MKRTGRIFLSALLVLVLLVGLSAPGFATGITTPKNVIVMISDGCGYNQYLATDYYLYGEAGATAQEQFPIKLGMSTYSHGASTSTFDDGACVYDSAFWDNYYSVTVNTTDSAAAATAMSTGVKTYDAAIGKNQDQQDLKHISQDFEALGKATGVVTSVPFCHATPCGFVAHNTDRNNYVAIADEMITSSATDVIMGCGNPYYDDFGVERSAPKWEKYISEATWTGLTDGTLTVADADGDGTADPWTLITTRDEFESLENGPAPERLIGIAQVATTLQEYRILYTPDADINTPYALPLIANVPTLETMAKGALNVLDNDEDGFFLMIEGGAVDWAGHFMQTGSLIEEQEDFNKTVNAVIEWIEENSSWEETLLIVTGDHETGYLTGTPGVNDEPINNGKGVVPTVSYYFHPGWGIAWHTNQLVPFFAKGCGSDLYNTFADQTDTVRGKYIDNTEISAVIRTLLGIAPSSWAIRDVYQAVDHSLVPMSLQGNYQSNITREQFCNLAYALMKKCAVTTPMLKPSDTAPMPFTDTASETIYTLNQLDIINGKSATEFAPNSPITREEAAKVLREVAYYLGIAIPQNAHTYADQSSISGWAKTPVADMYALGVLTGVSGNNFAPKANYTVEQSILSMLRLFMVKIKAA